MGYKTAVILGLLPQLLYASVTCNFSAAASSGDTCASFASAWGQTVDEFKALNPGVSCPNLTAGQSYCVVGIVTDPTSTSTTSTTVTTSKPPPPLPLPPPRGPAPGPTQPGIPANCDKFHLVASGDLCDTIATKYSITEAQFKSWNPTIDDTCSNLWLDYYVCVHVPGAATGPQPQMPGIVSNCKQFYKVKSGDSCYTINTAAGITLAQFRKWNTQIDAGCSNLWVGYYVCTGV
ncbi:hypothetical protein BDV59DRAFT_208451 [Aspergillus ambiguus]|uniref:LysM peptidoglycan-binding domain-containing protein n=1 Tax=Aspergillus ambiguus TaxID=176160 RepID=UPI003CCDFB93